MSGRIYDQSGKATCKKCGSNMLLSQERNFNGPKCKNKKCDGSLLDALYDDSISYPGYYVNFIKEIENNLDEK
jgi:hypothetical protein